jgi:RNA polymerase sigma-70 factor (ECF subfamily)
LLDGFRRGDREAIERVYHAYVDQVAHLLRKGFTFMSGGQPVHFRGYANAWDLECAVQDTFSHAFSPAAREAYDGVSPFGPYLITIARNQVISRLRRDFREFRRRTALAADLGPQGPETPEESAIRSEREQLVEEFRATLTAAQLRFLDLRFREERPLLETARMLGMTRMKARTFEQKIKQALLRFLKKRGVLGGGA